VLAFLTAPDVAARILEHLARPAAVPPVAPARGPPADDLELTLPLADF
jgi:hypothetical protein